MTPVDGEVVGFEIRKFGNFLLFYDKLWLEVYRRCRYVAVLFTRYHIWTVFPYRSFRMVRIMSYGVYCTAGCLLPYFLSHVLFRYLLSPSLPVHNPLSVMVHVTGIDALVFLKSNTRLILSRFRLFFAVFWLQNLWMDFDLKLPIKYGPNRSVLLILFDFCSFCSLLDCIYGEIWPLRAYPNLPPNCLKLPAV